MLMFPEKESTKLCLTYVDSAVLPNMIQVPDTAYMAWYEYQLQFKKLFW